MNAAWVDAGISRVRECGSPLEFHQVMRGGAWHSNPCPSLHKAVLLLCHEHAMVGVRVLGSNGTVKKGAPGCSSWRASGITTTHAEEDTHQHTPKPHTVSKGVSSACPHTQLCWSCALIHLRAILRSRKLLNTPTSITAPPPPPQRLLHRRWQLPPPPQSHPQQQPNQQPPPHMRAWCAAHAVTYMLSDTKPGHDLLRVRQGVWSAKISTPQDHCRCRCSSSSSSFFSSIRKQPAAAAAEAAPKATDRPDQQQPLAVVVDPPVPHTSDTPGWCEIRMNEGGCNGWPLAATHHASCSSRDLPFSSLL